MLKKSRYLPSGSNCAREFADGAAKNGGWKLGSSCPNASLPDVKRANSAAIIAAMLVIFFGCFMVFTIFFRNLEVEVLENLYKSSKKILREHWDSGQKPNPRDFDAGRRFVETRIRRIETWF